jgi:acetyltransferase-like isoleucine patch superfamily enzyme
LHRNTVLFLFSSYSYLLNLVYWMMELLPNPMRILAFRLMLGSVGKAALIDYGVYFRYPSKISLGNNVAINRDCAFYAVHQAVGGTITIGNNVALGPHVRVFAGGHDYGTTDLLVTAAPVVVHDFVWIGGNSTILQGVTIGEGAVIGAGSVVSRDIPPYGIAAGNPAKVIKYRELSKIQASSNQ